MESETYKLRRFVAGLPKADLHVHFEGTVSPEILLELGRKNAVNIEAPVKLTGGKLLPPPLLQGGVPPSSFASFEDFIRYYVKIAECIKSVDDMLLIASAYGQNCRNECVTHSDMYFSPTIFNSLGRDVMAMFRGLAAVERLLKSEFNHRVRWIFDIVRNVSENGLEVIEYARAARGAGASVFAIGLAGDERKDSVSRFMQAFSEARQEGFVTLAHTGETAGAASICETIELLHPARIGHGVKCLEDKNLVARLAKEQLPLEVCPWSNVSLGLYETRVHPLPKMVRAGLNVIICSDDPGIFRRSLVDNYVLAHECGLSQPCLAAMAAQSLHLAG